LKRPRQNKNSSKKIINLFGITTPHSRLIFISLGSFWPIGFFVCIPRPIPLSILNDDREGFVGTPGPARWFGAPACFAAECPPPRVSFFRAFGQIGLQAFPQQSAPRFSYAAFAYL
jgi:hypothetical protein